GKKVWSGGTKGVIIIGNNGSQDAISAIKAHKMSVTYDGNSPQAGAMAVWAIAEKLKKHKRPPKLIVVKSTRYDSSNVNKYVPALSVTENILMGRLPRRGAVIDWPRAHRLAQEALAQLEVHVDERRRVDALSIELQQEVEVARAVSARSRVLILDEATSSLSES